MLSLCCSSDKRTSEFVHSISDGVYGFIFVSVSPGRSGGRKLIALWVLRQAGEKCTRKFVRDVRFEIGRRRSQIGREEIDGRLSKCFMKFSDRITSMSCLRRGREHEKIMSADNDKGESWLRNYLELRLTHDVFFPRHNVKSNENIGIREEEKIYRQNIKIDRLTSVLSSEKYKTSWKYYMELLQTWDR